MSNLSQSQKDLVLSISKQSGFEGFKSDKGYINGQKCAKSKLLATLDLLEQLKNSGTIEGMGIAVNWSSLKGEVESYLYSIKREQKSVAEHIDISDREAEGFSNYKKFVAEEIRVVRAGFKEGLETYTGKLGKGEPPLLFIDTVKRRLLTTRDMAPDMILTDMGITDSRELAKDPKVVVVFPEFRPYCTEMIITGDRRNAKCRELNILNTYPVPEWQKLKVKGQYRGVPRKIMENLFPIEEERLYVLCWVKQMIIGRNNTVLVLLGDRGTGKSKFSEMLQALVGLDYSQMLDISLLTDKFTSQIHEVRLGVFEEVSLGAEPKTIEKIKSMTNARLKVESKGGNAFSSTNECSFVMSLNKSSNLGVKPTERRFSIPEIGTPQLDRVIPGFELNRRENAWLGKSTDPEILEELAEFGHYLLEMDTGTWTDTVPLRGAAFYKATRASQPDWELAIIDLVIKEGRVGTKLPLKDAVGYLADKYKSVFPKKVTTIESFLADYKYENLHKLGTIEYGWKETGRGRSAVIIPNPEFLEAFGEHPEKMTAGPETATLKKTMEKYKSPEEKELEAAAKAAEELL